MELFKCKQCDHESFDHQEFAFELSLEFKENYGNEFDGLDGAESLDKLICEDCCSELELQLRYDRNPAPYEFGRL